MRGSYVSAFTVVVELSFSCLDEEGDDLVVAIGDRIACSLDLGIDGWEYLSRSEPSDQSEEGCFCGETYESCWCGWANDDSELQQHEPEQFTASLAFTISAGAAINAAGDVADVCRDLFADKDATADWGHADLAFCIREVTDPAFAARLVALSSGSDAARAEQLYLDARVLVLPGAASDALDALNTLMQVLNWVPEISRPGIVTVADGDVPGSIDAVIGVTVTAERPNALLLLEQALRLADVHFQVARIDTYIRLSPGAPDGRLGTPTGANRAIRRQAPTEADSSFERKQMDQRGPIDYR